MKKPLQLNKDELNVMLRKMNIEVKPSYCHDDYMFTSFTMPYPTKAKLDRLSKRFGLTRSATVRLLIEMIEE